MLQIPVGAKVCKIFNQIYLYPEQLEQIKQAITEMNQVVMGTCYLEGDPQGWGNFYPPNCAGILYEKINEYTYRRIGAIT